MGWTKFVPITQVFDIPHAIDENTDNDIWDGMTMDGKTGGIKGAGLIKDNPHLSQRDAGIYHIRVKKTSLKHRTKSWNYIGKSAKITGKETVQLGIAGRILEHINELQGWPKRPDIVKALKKKFNNDGGRSPNPQEVEMLRQDFIKAGYPDYQAMRDYLSIDNQMAYKLRVNFKDFFLENQNGFKNYDSTLKFFQKCVEIRFIKLPMEGYTNTKAKPYRTMINQYKENNTYYKKNEIEEIKISGTEEQKANLQMYENVITHFKNHVALAEATCMGAYLTTHKILPELNSIDETMGFLEDF
jgi:hypothetical protein